MVGYRSTLVVLVTGASLVAASPCSYGALCGKSACDDATVAAFQAALPQLKACDATFAGYTAPYPGVESEATLRRLCLTGVCRASFKTIVKFYDIEANVCELNYPTRVTDLVYMGLNDFLGMCLPGRFHVAAYPTLNAELTELVAEARGTAASTTSPSVTTKPPAPATTTPPAPVTTTPEPTTRSPTPTTPTTTPTSPATPAPATATPVPSTSNATADGSRDGSSSTIVQPQATSMNTNSSAAVPSPSTPKKSLATSTRDAAASLLCVVALAAIQTVSMVA